VTTTTTNQYSSPNFAGSGAVVQGGYSSNKFGGNFTTPHTGSGVGALNTNTTYQKYESTPGGYQSSYTAGYQSSTAGGGYQSNTGGYQSSTGGYQPLQTNYSSTNYGYGLSNQEGTKVSNNYQSVPFGDPKTYEEFQEISKQGKLIDGLSG
jgi:hypothetical protein